MKTLLKTTLKYVIIKREVGVEEIIAADYNKR